MGRPAALLFTKNVRKAANCEKKELALEQTSS